MNGLTYDDDVRTLSILEGCYLFLSINWYDKYFESNSYRKPLQEGDMLYLLYESHSFLEV